MIALLDDATSELTARLALHDSTAENMRLLEQYLEQHGRSVEVYTDKASMFQVNRPLHYNKHLEGAPEPTQIERALQELGIGRIAAHSPQAKGRIEPAFGVLQDRLVKGLRHAGVCTLEEANRYLGEEFVPEWNRRFTKPPASPVDAHRPLRQDHQLASILSHVDERRVGNDYTAADLGVGDPFDPTQNLSAGARFLRQLLDRYGGNLALALGAYNAGPRHVDQLGRLPLFPETVNYVSTILARLGKPLADARGSDPASEPRP